MARKPLLTEAEIRSFMKLANLAPIGDAKMNEMGYYGKDDDKDDVKEEGAYYGKDDDKDKGGDGGPTGARGGVWWRWSTFRSHTRTCVRRRTAAALATGRGAPSSRTREEVHCQG